MVIVLTNNKLLKQYYVDVLHYSDVIFVPNSCTLLWFYLKVFWFLNRVKCFKYYCG